MSQSPYRAAFALVVLLFFMWGFLTSLNDILIPHLKAVFDLSYAQAMLVQFAFFASYFAVSIPAGWLIERIGFGRGIVAGLTLMALGCFLFFPASAIPSYPLFLVALFVLASGITVLQVAANPYVSAVGDPSTASSRLNLAQGFNSLAHTIAPIFGTLLILDQDATEIASPAALVQLPYLGIGGTLLLLAVLFMVARLPNITAKTSVPLEGVRSVFAIPHLMWGVLAIFLYVGIEVSIGGFLVNFFGEADIANLPEQSAGHYVSFYWGGAMVGRFIGSALLQRMKPQRLLAICAACALVLVLLCMTLSGPTAMVAILMVGLFNSVMFPNIFTMSIQGLGPYTSRGSGLLVMAIVGGAVIPLLQGLLADAIGVQASFGIGLLCYGYILLYALRLHRAGLTHQ